MADEIHMRAVDFGAWNLGLQDRMRLLCRTFGGQQPEARRHPKDVGIHRKGGLSTGEEQDTGDRFRTDSGKFRQGGPRGRHGQLLEKIEAQASMTSEQTT
jgi:hypothetical protein